MNQLTRREFIDRLGKLGLILAGSILVPYIPKVIYSIPSPKILSLKATMAAYNAVLKEYYLPVTVKYLNQPAIYPWAKEMNHQLFNHGCTDMKIGGFLNEPTHT